MRSRRGVVVPAACCAEPGGIEPRRLPALRGEVTVVLPVVLLVRAQLDVALLRIVVAPSVNGHCPIAVARLRSYHLFTMLANLRRPARHTCRAAASFNNSMQRTALRAAGDAER